MTRPTRFQRRGATLLSLRGRRTRVVRIFPNAANCPRLTRAMCVETHEGLLEDKCYISMDLLWEARKDQPRKAAYASDDDHLFAQLDVHDPGFARHDSGRYISPVATPAATRLPPNALTP